MLPQLASEGLGLGYQTIDQECGAFTYTLATNLGRRLATSAATLTTAANNYPVVTIETTDPKLSG